MHRITGIADSTALRLAVLCLAMATWGCDDAAKNSETATDSATSPDTIEDGGAERDGQTDASQPPAMDSNNEAPSSDIPMTDGRADEAAEPVDAPPGGDGPSAPPEDGASTVDPEVDTDREDEGEAESEASPESEPSTGANPPMEIEPEAEPEAEPEILGESTVPEPAREDQNATPEEPDLPQAEEIDLETSTVAHAALFIPEASPEAPTRPRRRMNIDQLNAAIMRVSGGIAWTEQRGNNEVNLFNELSATLGKPNYTTITHEDLEPSTLFQKFLGDAARSVCGKMVAQDLTGDHESILLPAHDDAESIDTHLIEILSRFHSRALNHDSRDLAQWRWLYDSSWFVTRDSVQAWNAICVALFVHPDFYTY